MKVSNNILLKLEIIASLNLLAIKAIPGTNSECYHTFKNLQEIQAFRSEKQDFFCAWLPHSPECAPGLGLAQISNVASANASFDAKKDMQEE
jgi:hypothetical protein